MADRKIHGNEEPFDWQKPEDKRYEVELDLELPAYIRNKRWFKTKAGAIRYVEIMEARLKEAALLVDAKIWSSIEIIYLTRWDCPTARLAAAR